MKEAKTRRIATREEDEIQQIAAIISPPIPELTCKISRAGSLTRSQKLRLAIIALPNFSGDMKDYPSFKRDWKNIVEGELEDADQQFQIKGKVPAHGQRNIENMSSMAEGWLT